MSLFDCISFSDVYLINWWLRVCLQCEKHNSRALNITQCEALRRTSCRPLTVQRLRVGQVFLELFVQVFTDADVLEHSLQLGRVLEPARLLQENKSRGSFSLRVSVLLCACLPADGRRELRLLPALSRTFSLEIMLASASSLALFWWTRRLASILA